MLPPAQSGWFSVSYAVTMEGHLARLCASEDVYRQWRELRLRRMKGEMVGALIVARDTLGRVDVFDGRHVSDGPRFALESSFPRFDRRADGSWIVADARCPVGEFNARVIQADGTVIRRLCLGDGIEHLQCDHLDSIWVGYFDEGVHGSFGWGPPNGPMPIGAAGINCFDEYGNIRPVHRLVDQSGASTSDCEAMNVTRNGVWLCPYYEFPILWIGYGGDQRLWRSNGIHGATALAVGGNYVVVVGGYMENLDRGLLFKLGEDGAELLWRFRFDVDGAAFDSLRLVTARNDTMHFVTDDAWYCIDVAEIAAMVL